MRFSQAVFALTAVIATVDRLRLRLTDFAFSAVIFCAVLGTAPASAVSYIVSGIPFADYDPTLHTDMNIRVTFVLIDDPTNTFYWYTKDVDIDITSISGILYGTTRRVTSPTPYPTPGTNTRMRTNPNPFLGWTCNAACDAQAPTEPIVYENVVPIPAALPLFATGLAGLAWLARRRRKQATA